MSTKWSQAFLVEISSRNNGCYPLINFSCHQHCVSFCRSPLYLISDISRSVQYMYVSSATAVGPRRAPRGQTESSAGPARPGRAGANQNMARFLDVDLKRSRSVWLC